MEQSTLIILAIVFVAIVMAMQPAVCDCTSEGAAAAPVMSAYLRKQVQLPGYIEHAAMAFKNNIELAPRAVNENFELAPMAQPFPTRENFGQGILKQYLKQGGLGAVNVPKKYIETVQKRRPT